MDGGLMKITILTLFPEMFEGFLNTSIIKKARLKGLVSFELIDIRAFSTNKHHRVDDYAFGGGQGLLMTLQPVVDALQSIHSTSKHVVLTSPKGQVFNQIVARRLSQIEDLVLICAHYEGIDERISNYIDEEISIGDYILTGGELPAMVISDALVRLVKGVIKEASHQEESFETSLLEHPHYTRPVDFEGFEVPEVLMSGHHEDIRKYRLKESIRQTWLKRPDLFKGLKLDAESLQYLLEVIQETAKSD
jgi:tRNA (guanine37-N1)-methyltransferase